jgi:hypothetical protein
MYWLIPEGDLRNLEKPKAGRPPKPKPEKSENTNKKAVNRWEGEGGALLPKARKKGGKK